MEQVIPEFMKKYYEGCDEEGQEHIKVVAARYEHQKQLFYQTTFNHKSEFQKDWNRLAGQRNQLTEDEAIKPLNDKYEAQVKEIALEYGYIDPDAPMEELDKLYEQDEMEYDISEASQEEIEISQREELDELLEQQAVVEKGRDAARQEFLDNLKSIRERGVIQAHRPHQ